MRRSWFWIPPLAIAAAILWLSDQPRYPLGITLSPPLDKGVHALVFCALAFFLDVALRNVRRDLPVYRRHLWIFVMVALYGVSDEWHQTFVPGRDGNLLDWLADAAGAAVGLGLASWSFLMGGRSPVHGWQRGCDRRPDPARPLIIVADPHWGEELTGLREVTLQRPGADWLFLGDVFDVWAGVPGMQTESQRSFLWWVQQRRAAGRWVGLWMGNREYFLDRLAPQFDLLGEGVGGALAEEGLAFEHGDLVNRADRRFRLWNLLSRSAFTWLLMRLLPGSWGQTLACRLERSLRTTNRSYRLTFPREAFRAAAGEHAGATFLTGHFHTHEIEGNGVALPWAHEGAFALWHEGRLELLPAPARSDATFLPSTHP